MYNPIIVQAGEESPQWTMANIITCAYLAGVTLFLIRFIMQLIWLRYNLKEKKGSAFSFFRTLVVDSSLPEKETIINHERVHIRQWHSADVILIELAAIINWFNPVIYLYKKEIRHIHEFIADEEAAGLQQSKSDYALILLSTTLGVNPHQLSNSFFNQSLIKRRIVMLSKNRSPRTGLFKYGLCAPLFAVMLIFSSATISSEKTMLVVESKRLIEALKAADQPDAYKSFLKRNPAVKELAWKIKPYRVIVYLKNGSTETYNMDNANEKASATNKYGEFPYPPPPPPMPPKPGDEKIAPPPPPVPSKTKINEGSKTALKSLSQHLAKHILYPAMAKDNKMSGSVVADFRIKNNFLNDVKIFKGAGYGMDEEVARVVASYTQPLDLEDGQYTLGVVFELEGVTNRGSKPNLDKSPNYLGSVFVVGYPKDYKAPVQDDIKDLTSVKVLPEFPGGEKEFGAFLSQNIKYPELARINKITGRVFLTFIVEKDGSLSGIKVLRGLGYGTDEEAVRVIKNSPKWKPGIDNGNPVRVQYTIPISFNLAKKDGSKTLLTTTFPDALYLVNGHDTRIEDVKKINPASIKSINVLKGDAATEKYGKKDYKGIVEITTITRVGKKQF